MGKLTVLDHPLIRHKLTLLRLKDTEPWLFRHVVNEITYLMLYESTRDLRTKKIEIETPLQKTKSDMLDQEIIVVPILRAGLGMLDGLMKLMPMTKVGFIGLYRNEETLEPIEYYSKTPPLDKAEVFVADPMLATGGSVIAAIDLLKKKGARRIRFMCILAAPEGIKLLQETHPDVDIFAAGVDEGLNENGYIVPGIGDCGDRYFWTT